MRLLERVTERTRIVFIANPNNPTGTYLPISEMRRLHAGLPPHVLLAIDAAYAEFVNRNDFEPGVSLVDRAENVVMLRTFSKIYALAGLRLGWAYCPPAIADVLNRIRGPFNVTAPALAAGIAAVEDTEALRRAQAHNERWLPWLSERLAALGLQLTPSVANFVLPRFPDDPSTTPTPPSRSCRRAASWCARWRLMDCRSICGSRSAPGRKWRGSPQSWRNSWGGDERACFSTGSR